MSSRLPIGVDTKYSIITPFLKRILYHYIIITAKSKDSIKISHILILIATVFILELSKFNTVNSFFSLCKTR